jgi:predicted RNase H-like HicB family nuclease
MKTIALIEKGKDGLFGIFTPDIESTIVGSGASVAEAKADFENSVREMIASYDGDILPKELQDIEFEYKYDMASVFNAFGWINISKFAEHVGINASLMRQYKSGNTYISENQVAKIEHGLHKVGRELLSISL